jgi:hypothetical protein
MVGLTEVATTMGKLGAELMSEAILRRQGAAGAAGADAAEKDFVHDLVAMAQKAIDDCEQIPSLLKPMLKNEGMLASLAKSIDDAAEKLVSDALKLVGR